MNTRYITTEAIGEARQGLRDNVIPTIDRVKQVLEESKSIGGPGWGPLGELIVGVMYRSVLDSFIKDTDSALSVLGDWEGDKLRYAEQNWRTAEDLAIDRAKRI